MNRTDNPPQCTHGLQSLRCQNRSIRSCLFVFILVVLLSCCQGKETVLLSSLGSKNDKILLGILKQTNYLLQSQKIIKGKKYQCLTIIKNDLLKNKVWTYQPIKYSITYLDLVFYQGYLISGQIFEQKDRLLNFRLAKILSPLKGVCVYYRTTTFLTEYCHQEHVRQYDDDYTKYYNQKPAYEDFSLGKFHISLVKLEQTKKEDPVPNMPPKISDFSKKYQHSFVDKITGESDFIEVQQEQQGKLLHSNAPIVSSSSYLQQYPVFAAIECKQAHTGKKIFNLGLVVNPFDVVYTKKEGVCVAHGQLRTFNASIKYDHLQEVRVYRQFMFGKVEETCTKKWNWQRQGKPFQYARLRPGSTLFIEYYDGKAKKHYNKIVTIKKVHHPELIELEEELGSSFPTKRKTLFDKPNEDIQIVTELNRCELVFNKKLNQIHKTYNNQYVSKGIMILDESILVEDEMNRLGCICQLQKDITTVYKIDMDVTVGKNLWGNYYKVYFTTNQKIYLQRQFKDVLFSECKTLICHRYSQITVDQQESQRKGFTSIVDLDNQNKIYNVSAEGMENIYVVSIFKGGIIRLVTVDSEGNQHVYILSEGQILKIRQFQNGTKEIEKQNSFYENATRYSDQNIYNTLYIYCFRLSNGTYYGGIWKHRQYLFFPRLRMPGERILYFEVSSGYSYIRKLDLSLMERPAVLPFKKYAKMLEEQYLWEEQRNYHTQKGEELNSMFLNQSYSINFTYAEGDYCGAPINQHRQTTVTLKCGGSWYQISEIRETKPCTYWIQVQTLLLCEENLKIVAEQDDEIPNKTELDKIIASGMVCTKKEGLFDEGHTLLYPGKKMLSSK